MVKKEEIKELVGVLRGMAEYLFMEDCGHHIRKGLIYCNPCRAISAFGEDHDVYRGTDCGGDSYGTEKSSPHCLKCHGADYVDISLTDLEKLKGVYRGRTAEVLLEGIKNGIERMSSPTLYNKDLPGLAAKWKRVPKAKKAAQMNALLRLSLSISESKQNQKRLENILSGGEK